MYIRQTRTNNKATGEGYFTYRLVRGERIGGKVRQITVLNLGRHFPFKRENWPLLCSRIEYLLRPTGNAASSTVSGTHRARRATVCGTVDRAGARSG